MNKPGFSILNYAAVIAILLVLIMTVLDVTLVNVALPVMASRFGITDSAAVWILTIYQLVITMLLLPVSSAGDLFSYRRCGVSQLVQGLSRAPAEHQSLSHLLLATMS